MTADPFSHDRFHWCALAAGFIAAAEGRLDDSRYVQRVAYEFYESGAFRDRVPPSPGIGQPRLGAVACSHPKPARRCLPPHHKPERSIRKSSMP